MRRGFSLGANDRKWPLADLQNFDNVGYRTSALGETGRSGLISRNQRFQGRLYPR